MWKASLLPLLYHGLDEDCKREDRDSETSGTGLPASAKVSEMTGLARGTAVQLKRAEGREGRFVLGA